MKKPNKEAGILFAAGLILISLAVPLIINGEALGLAAGVFGVSGIIMSFGWRD